METMTYALYLLVALPVIGAVIYRWYLTTYKFIGTEYEFYSIGRNKENTGDILSFTGNTKVRRFRWKDKNTILLKTLDGKRVISKDACGSFFANNKFVYGHYKDHIYPFRFNMDTTPVEAVLIPDALEQMCIIIEEENRVEFTPKKAWYEQPGLLTLGVVIVLAVLTGVTIYFVWKFTQPDVQQLGMFSDAINNLANNYGGKPLGVPPQ